VDAPAIDIIHDVRTLMPHIHPSKTDVTAGMPTCSTARGKIVQMAAHELLTLLGPELNPQSPCITSGDRTMSRGEVWEEATALARAVELQVPPGHRIGLVDTQNPSSIVGILAAFIAGRSVALLPVSGVNDPEVQNLASDARCAAVLVGGMVERVSRPSPDDPLGLLAPSAGLGPDEVASPEVVVLYTSGTTRKPRGVRLSSRNIASNLSAMMRFTAPWTPADRLGQILPVTHSFGLSMALLALARETPIVLLGDGPPSRRLAAAFDLHGVTVFACVPYFLRLMSRRGLSLGGDCAHQLRALYLAGGGVSDADLHTLVPDYLGDVYLMYGFTEATARVAVRRMGDGAAPDSVGLPLPGTYVDIISADGKVQPPGSEGFIRASSPCLMIGYLGQAPRTRGSAFVTTDLGIMDVCGNLSITGRDSEVMNFRGNRVSVVSVEATMMQMTGVLDARLKPDSRNEDTQCTLRVVAEADAHRGELRREIIRTVTPKGLIREITFVEELEKTRSGKPIRREATSSTYSLGGNGA
jgi:acyl-coenzyme A synthetase/AMP-(fatty) acid ligase